MSDGKEPAVSLPVIEFVDREIAKERLLTISERERLREVVMEKFTSASSARETALATLTIKLATLTENQTKMEADLLKIAETQANQAGRYAAYLLIMGVLSVLVQFLLRMWK